MSLHSFEPVVLVFQKALLVRRKGDGDRDKKREKGKGGVRGEEDAGGGEGCAERRLEREWVPGESRCVQPLVLLPCLDNQD